MRVGLAPRSAAAPSPAAWGRLLRVDWAWRHGRGAARPPRVRCTAPPGIASGAGPCSAGGARGGVIAAWPVIASEAMWPSLCSRARGAAFPGQSRIDCLGCARAGWFRRACSTSRRRGRPPLGLGVAHEFAEARGGVCLSDQYTGVMTHLRWRCGDGHEWSASLNNIKNGRRWCPVCAGNSRLSLDTAHRVAAERGGECLSQKYSNNRSLLSWRCAIGHQWCASLGKVRNNGTWCPHCAGNARLSLHIAHTLAAERGGACISCQYVNIRGHLLWRCAKGHEWSASLNKVKNSNTWCPYCATGSSEQEVRSIFETIFWG